MVVGELHTVLCTVGTFIAFFREVICTPKELVIARSGRTVTFLVLALPWQAFMYTDEW